MRTALITPLAAFALIIAGSCASHGPKPLASKVVGPEGAHMEAPGIALDIPPGAIAGSQTISIFAGPPAANGETPLAKAFRFEPSGLEFAHPISVHLDVPAGANGLVRWTRLGDPANFEFAGFVIDGVAHAQNTHFSDVKTTQEDPNTCADLENGEPMCQQSSAPEADCRELCGCIDSDPMPATMDLPNKNLCELDPANDNGVCTVDPALPPMAAPTEQFGERDGDACTGWGWVSTEVYTCYCTANPVVEVAGAAPTTPALCALPEAKQADGAWHCDTTLSYPACFGLSCPPTMPTQMPVDCSSSPPDKRLCDYNLGAYVGNGPTDNEGCLGYYLYDDGTGNKVNKGTAGHLTTCGLNTILSQWKQLPGKTANCRTFDKDPNFPDIRNSNDKQRCRLSPNDWAKVQMRRASCLPVMTSDVDERIPINDKGETAAATVAILSVPDEANYPGCFSELTGLSSGVWDVRKAPPECPDQKTIMQTWRGIGYTDPDTGKNSNSTAAHAEGNALLQLAEQRGRKAPQPPYDPKNIMASWGAVDGTGRTGGCGDMIVDRGACKYSCGPEGIFNAMATAGLDKLFVHSPDGCLVFEQGVIGPDGKPVTQGQPCASDGSTCASP